jgi:segregation and condensation protein B
MNLKAKLEAVIYAAEEPVTLAQLAALFADEALAWKAEQDAVSAAMPAASLAPAATDPAALPLLSEAFTYLELELDAVREAPAEGEAGAEADRNDAGGDPSASLRAGSRTAADQETVATTDGGTPEAVAGTPSEVLRAVAGESALEEAGEAGAADKAQEEVEARRQAKQRERDARVSIGQILGELIAEYAADGRGIEIREVAGGYRMATKPEFHDAVRSFVKSLKPPLKLSLPALETLAVIAYKQPVTAPEVNEIRGVDSSGVFGSLLARKLIVTAGRKPVIGRPILYKTTREFLLRFGLKDVSELPSMEEFEKMAASELDEAEPAQEETANSEVAEFNPDPSVEQDEAEAVAPEAPAAQENPSERAQSGAE